LEGEYTGGERVANGEEGEEEEEKKE